MVQTCGWAVLDGSTVANADYDLYYLQVYDVNNNLINNLLPAKNVKTNKVGLLDMVNANFIEYM